MALTQVNQQSIVIPNSDLNVDRYKWDWIVKFEVKITLIHIRKQCKNQAIPIAVDHFYCSMYSIVHIVQHSHVYPFPMIIGFTVNFKHLLQTNTSHSHICTNTSAPTEPNRTEPHTYDSETPPMRFTIRLFLYEYRSHSFALIKDVICEADTQSEHFDRNS